MRVQREVSAAVVDGDVVSVAVAVVGDGGDSPRARGDDGCDRESDIYVRDRDTDGSVCGGA